MVNKAGLWGSGVKPSSTKGFLLRLRQREEHGTSTSVAQVVWLCKGELNKPESKDGKNLWHISTSFEMMLGTEKLNL